MNTFGCCRIVFFAYISVVDIDPLPTTVAKVSRIDIKPMISIAEAINKGQSDTVSTTAEPTSSSNYSSRKNFHLVFFFSSQFDN